MNIHEYALLNSLYSCFWIDVSYESETSQKYQLVCMEGIATFL